MDINQHVENIKKLRSNGGLFLASSQGVETGYDKAWLRDNFYISLGLEAAGEWELVEAMWRAILEIFNKHRDKIDWAAEHRPHESWQYIHARYHPETFEEFWEEWGNKQNDAVGAILYKLGDLEATGYGVIQPEDQETIQRLVDYLASIEYWHDPDNGVWEEYEEVHASSVGACVAGLRQVARLDFIHVPDELITQGEAALADLLPRESESKFCDLAQLSLFYPYNLVDETVGDIILERLEYHLARRRGVVRYKNDHYYNRNEDGFSEEAEWCFGFPWLAIIHHERGDDEAARYWLEQAEETVTEAGVPELYYSNTDEPNENNPLGWSESMLVVAKSKITNS
ncbi:MAG: glycoside hydrolase family 15 protein [Candidatus Paceibacterota bacterium]